VRWKCSRYVKGTLWIYQCQ